MDRCRKGAGAWIVATALLLLLGLVFLLAVGPALWTCTDGSPRVVALLELKRLDAAISIFRRDQGRLPASLEELTRPVGEAPEPYLERVGQDPWGGPYVMLLRPDDSYRLASWGPDGQPDTEDDVLWPLPAGA